ncbi:MAG TPA: hypothetical protein PLF78_00910 [Caulobacter sp.]|nr:hypothetical protein [Caulobacter sp.]
MQVHLRTSWRQRDAVRSGKASLASPNAASASAADIIETEIVDLASLMSLILLGVAADCVDLRQDSARERQT